MTAFTSVIRWRLAVTLRSLRFVPPFLGLLVFLGLFFVQRGQEVASLVAIDLIALFVLGLGLAIAHLGALPRGPREITRVSVGRVPAFAGEVGGAATLALVAVALSVAWPLCLLVPKERPDVALGVSWFVLVAVAGMAGVATGCLLDGFRLRPPARLVVAIGAVALVLARPALAVAVSWPLPPVMDTARSAANHFAAGPAMWWTSAATLAWSSIALAAAYLIGDRFTDPE